MDSSVTYNLVIQTPVALTNAWLYDWYVVEFTKPTYLSQPQTGIGCNVGGTTVKCNVT